MSLDKLFVYLWTLEMLFTDLTFASLYAFIARAFHTIVTKPRVSILKINTLI
jgi:hypothetical protein